MKKHLWRGLLLTSLFFLFSSGCAYVAPEVIYRMQDDLREVKKEVADLRAEREREKKIYEEAVSGAQGGISASELEIRKKIASLQADLDALRGEIATFQGFIDETKYQMKQDQLRVGERLSDLDRRLVALEAEVKALREQTSLKAPAGVKMEKPQPSAGEGPSVTSSGEMRTPPVPESGAPPSGQVLTAEKEVRGTYRGTFETPEDLYSYALGLIKEGKYGEARRVLNEFASTYENHRLMPNVFYWRGETFYAEKDFESAALAFQEVIEKYPDSIKAPDALFKQGLCFLNMKDRAAARSAFTLVISRYPASDAAKKAKEKLRELEAQGG